MQLLPTLSNFRPAPSLSDATTLKQRLTDTVEDIVNFVPQMQSLISAQNILSEEIGSAAVMAEMSANNAALSELNAIASANFKGVWYSSRIINGITLNGYSVGESVLAANNLFYVCLVTHTTPQDPTVTTGYWKINIPIGAIGNIQNPIFFAPLKNSLALHAGVGNCTFTRASTATYKDPYNIRLISPIDTVRFGKGTSLIKKVGYVNEGASTNLALYSADLTNSVWNKTNGNTAKDATGWDNISNSASTFTAISNNATVLQTVALASAERTYSVAIKRKTGSGLVFITIDGGITWLDITSAIYSSKFVTLKITAILSNPSFGIKLETNGDAVYVDENQLEALPFVTSYIPTTSVAVTRAADFFYADRALNIPNMQNNDDGITISFDYETYGVTAAFYQLMWSLSQNSSDQFYISINGASYLRSSIYNAGGTVSNIATTESLLSNRVTVSISNTSLKTYVNGVLKDTDTPNGALTDSCNSVAKFRIGGSGNSPALMLYGHISNLRIWDKVLTAQEVALA